MERLKSLLRGLRPSPAPSLATLDTAVPDYPVLKHRWDGLAGGVVEAEDRSGGRVLIKYWRQGVQDAAAIEADMERLVLGTDVVPLLRWEQQDTLLLAVQPVWGRPLTEDAIFAHRFSLQDSDNRLELALELSTLLARLEASAQLPRHFAAWQFVRHASDRWILDALGAPYPAPRLRRLLARRGVDDMHLLPWPAPPDVLTGRREPVATAIWCLGHLIFELLSGRPPFGHADDTLSGMSMLLEGAPSLRTLNPQISRSLDRLIRRMLAGDPAMRPSSIAECADQLRKEI